MPSVWPSGRTRAGEKKRMDRCTLSSVIKPWLARKGGKATSGHRRGGKSDSPAWHKKERGGKVANLPKSKRRGKKKGAKATPMPVDSRKSQRKKEGYRCSIAGLRGKKGGPFL